MKSSKITTLVAPVSDFSHLGCCAHEVADFSHMSFSFLPLCMECRVLSRVGHVTIFSFATATTQQRANGIEDLGDKKYEQL